MYFGEAASSKLEKKNKKVWYAYSDEELDSIPSEVVVTRTRDPKRYKGLCGDGCGQLGSTYQGSGDVFCSESIMMKRLNPNWDLTLPHHMGDKVEPRRESTEEKCSVC